MQDDPPPWEANCIIANVTRTKRSEALNELYNRNSKGGPHLTTHCSKKHRSPELRYGRPHLPTYYSKKHRSQDTAISKNIPELRPEMGEQTGPGSLEPTLYAEKEHFKLRLVTRSFYEGTLVLILYEGVLKRLQTIYSGPQGVHDEHLPKNHRGA